MVAILLFCGAFVEYIGLFFIKYLYNNNVTGNYFILRIRRHRKYQKPRLQRPVYDEELDAAYL